MLSDNDTQTNKLDVKAALLAVGYGVVGAGAFYLGASLIIAALEFCVILAGFAVLLVAALALSILSSPALPAVCAVAAGCVLGYAAYNHFAPEGTRARIITDSPAEGVRPTALSL